MKADLMSLKVLMGNRLNIYEFITRPELGSIQPSSWNNNMPIKGRISEESLKGLFPKASEEVKIMVCGPPSMMDTMCGEKKEEVGRNGGILKQLGYDMKNSVFNF